MVRKFFRVVAFLAIAGVLVLVGLGIHRDGYYRALQDRDSKPQPTVWSDSPFLEALVDSTKGRYYAHLPSELFVAIGEDGLGEALKGQVLRWDFLPACLRTNAYIRELVDNCQQSYMGWSILKTGWDVVYVQKVDPPMKGKPNFYLVIAQPQPQPAEKGIPLVAAVPPEQ